MKFEEENLKIWENVIRDIFEGETPKNKYWGNVSEIVDIINKLGSKSSLCHMFYPDGGGMQVDHSQVSYEKNCIELLTGNISTIVKPKKLSFHFFGEDQFEWAYFRLETGGLSQSGVYNDNDIKKKREDLTELCPGEYVESSVYDDGYWGCDENGDEKRIPKTARRVSRILEGSFVFFATASSYNRNSRTYDARHEKMGNEKFEEYIRGVMNFLKNMDKG